MSETTTREASDRILKSINNGYAVSMSDIAELCKVLSLAERLKAEDEILHAANAEFSQAAIESHAEVLRLRAEITRLTSQLDLYKAALESIPDKLASHRFFKIHTYPDGIGLPATEIAEFASQWIKDRQDKGEG